VFWTRSPEILLLTLALPESMMSDHLLFKLLRMP
jgi:hypothetical protein